MDWTKESITLQRNLALGDAKHRKLVHNLYEDVRQGLADCLFAFAAQVPILLLFLVWTAD
jgi:hypothetical protein